jgi:hypothetical protein
VIQDIDFPLILIDDVYEPLILVARKLDRNRRSSSAMQITLYLWLPAPSYAVASKKAAKKESKQSASARARSPNINPIGTV